VAETFFAGAALGLAFVGVTFFGTAIFATGLGVFFLVTAGFGLTTAFLLGIGVAFAPFFEAVIII
jgi:hypothetical protein